MTLKHLIPSEKSDIIICVDWNPKTKTVEQVNWIVAQKGTSCIDITEQIENTFPDFVDSIDWAAEWVEEREYNNAFCNE